jgi:shikimate kinase
VQWYPKPWLLARRNLINWNMINSLHTNIFLIGPMGSGKTTIGKRVSRILNLDFYDCDQELERQTGASVNLIFDIEGEAGFRLRETRLLKELSRKKASLISTGGGVVCENENRRILRSRGCVVYLRTSIDNQLIRLSQDKTRPLLQADDKKKRLQSLAEVRNPLYAATADLTFDTSDQGVYLAAKAIASAILDHFNSGPSNADG